MLASRHKTESEDENSSSAERQGMLSGSTKQSPGKSACHRAVAYMFVACNNFRYFFSLALISLADWREAQLARPAYCE